VPKDLLRDAALGLGAGLAVAGLSRLAARAPAGRDMEAEFGQFIGRPGAASVAALAILSAVGEEYFFRGALQAHVGLWWQAAIFGACHFPPSRKLLAWPFFAGALGLAFGWMTAATGSLWAAILAHATINQMNLTFIARRED
jgi:hypothetical protein